MAEIAIKDAFAQHKAFIPFITCGDPDLETTEKIVVKMEQAGADLVELGIPFSDPTAEGPVIQGANLRALTIQGANLRALTGGVTTDKIFDMVKDLRTKVSIPMVFMTYANVVYSYGMEKFMTNAKAAGVQGLILPDVPYEEKEEFAVPAKAHGLELVSLMSRLWSIS